MSFMVTAIAVTAVTGIYGAYQTNEQGKATAKGIEDQAKVDHDAAAMQMELDSAEEGRVASAERKENRRLRAMQEAAYAGSGVLMEGSAADVLVKQRTVQEANVQNIHVAGGNQRAQDRWKAEGDFKSSMYLAKSTKYAAKQKAIMQTASALAGAGVGVAGLNAGAAAASNVGSGSAFSAAGIGSMPSAGVGMASNATTLTGSSLAGFGGASSAASFGQTASFGMMTPTSILGNTAAKPSAYSAFGPSLFKAR
tara:strand:- start:103 stop:861 length:759 start_codon:yes stop_codon:yes gene_type:complete